MIEAKVLAGSGDFCSCSISAVRSMDAGCAFSGGGTAFLKFGNARVYLGNHIELCVSCVTCIVFRSP